MKYYHIDKIRRVSEIAEVYIYIAFIPFYYYVIKSNSVVIMFK